MIQLIVVVLVLMVLVSTALLFLSYLRNESRRLYCSTYIRAIMYGTTYWAQNNGGNYPLPSALDTNNDTIALNPGEPKESKDTSANIFSLLIYNGVFPAEMCVTPSEKNPNIEPHWPYHFANPPAAVNPAKALWDPAFTADFTGKRKSGLSYAHALAPILAKTPASWLKTWATAPTEALVSNRGPQVAGVDSSVDPPAATLAKSFSYTHLIHGSRGTWDGNVGYNDNSVSFIKKTFSGTYNDRTGKPRADNLFFDETDSDAKGNNFLGIFVKGGLQRKDFVPIWD